MSSCIEMTSVPVCYTDADGVRKSLIAHYQFGADSSGATIPAGAIITEVDPSVVVDTSEGTVTAGACPVTPPDVEWTQLCDNLEDGTSVPFMCRTITSFDASGAVIDPVKVDYFELDKVTKYEVKGKPGKCACCDPVEAGGLQTSWKSSKA